MLSGIEQYTDEIHSWIVSSDTHIYDNEANSKPQPAQKRDSLNKTRQWGLLSKVCVHRQYFYEPQQPIFMDWYQSLVWTMYIVWRSQYCMSDRGVLNSIPNLHCQVFADLDSEMDHWAIARQIVDVQELMLLSASDS